MPATEMSGSRRPDLSVLWRERWPLCPPLAYELKHAYRDRWVRFHSLPGSKRYAEGEAEYAILLHRHNTVLSELFVGERVHIVTAGYGPPEKPIEFPCGHDQHTLNPGSELWTTLRDDDPYMDRWVHLYVRERPWEPEMIDPLLRAVADEECGDVIIMDTGLRRLYHPYDGGADCILETTEERDRLKAAHRDWLPRHTNGF